MAVLWEEWSCLGIFASSRNMIAGKTIITLYLAEKNREWASCTEVGDSRACSSALTTTHEDVERQLEQEIPKEGRWLPQLQVNMASVRTSRGGEETITHMGKLSLGGSDTMYMGS
jgi:hypothetical protein